MVVHQMGMPCNLSRILPCAGKYDIPVIEDAACALGSEIFMSKRWEKIGKPHGDIACFSFHPRKVMTTGEGGMVTTRSAAYDKKVRMMRNQGTRVRERKGGSALEDHPAIGYNYRLTDVQAAIGIEQLRKMGRMVSSRRAVARLYAKRLNDVPWLALPHEEPWARTNWQSYPVKVLECAPATRDRLIGYLLENGISTRPGIMNAHQEAPYRGHGRLKDSEEARDSVILLPLYCGLKDREICRIAEVLRNA
jgi:dTDP-4-amino-4,6-dideoxygalactose transaminase